MAQEGSRCGIASRGPLGSRASKAAAVALVALFACALPAAGSEPQALAGSATIVIHGQGRVTSEPAGAIDCPGDCSHTFSGSTSLTLRAAPASGWATSADRFLQRGGRLHRFAERLRLHAPRLFPAAREAPGLAERGRGDHAVADPGRLARRAGRDAVRARHRLLRHRLRVPLPSEHRRDSHGGCCRRKHVPRLERALLPGCRPCAFTLSRDSTSLVARFTRSRCA